MGSNPTLAAVVGLTDVGVERPQTNAMSGLTRSLNLRLSVPTATGAQFSTTVVEN